LLRLLVGDQFRGARTLGTAPLRQLVRGLVFGFRTSEFTHGVSFGVSCRDEPLGGTLSRDRQ